MTLSQLWGARRERCRTRVTPEGKRSPYTRHSFPATAGRPETALSSDFERTPLGARGKHRTGFYVATLYALERYYALQAASGTPLTRWRPFPRSRPNQFLTWAQDVLQTLDGAHSECTSTLLESLAAHGLPHVAQVLAATLEQRRHLTAVAVAPSGAERHPQVRKFARELAASFDPLWRAALERAYPLGRLVCPALPLGGLPPGMAVLEQLVSKLGQVPSSDLTALQFYGLAVGRLPVAPYDWQPGLSALEDLDPKEVEQLAGLSDAQLEQLRQLGDDALALLALRHRLDCDDHRWAAFGAVVTAMSPEDTEIVAAQLGTSRRRRLRLPGRHRTEAQRMAYLLAFWTLPGADLLTFKRSLSAAAWQEANLDAELRRLLGRGAFTPKLLSRLREWTPEELQAARVLLERQPLALHAWLEDRAFVDASLSERSDALLSLGELFPESVAWLERATFQGQDDTFAQLALSDIEELYDRAHRLQTDVEAQLRVSRVGESATPAA
jgi:hypothetical protein